jgi:hypothetical protein
MFGVASLKRNCVFFGLAAITAIACGGIDEPNFFDSSSGSTSPRDAGKSSNFADGDGGGTDSGDIITFDSGTTQPFDAGSTPPPDPGIYCGADSITSDPVYCTGKQICCAANDMLGAPTFRCSDENECTGDVAGDLVIPCDDTAECGSKICCGTFVTATTSYYSQVRCDSSCTGTAARVFCDPANGDSECAIVDATSTCAESGALPGFHVCSIP